MKNLSLKLKLFLVLGILTAVAVVVAFVGLNKLAGMNDRLNSIVNQSAEKVKLAARINQDLVEISRAEKNIILAETAEEMDKYADFIATTREEMKARRDDLRKLADEAGKTKLDEFAAKWDKYLEVNKQVRDYARLNSNAKARELSAGEGRTAYEEAERIMKELAGAGSQSGTDAAQTANGANEVALLAARVIQDMLAFHRGEKNLILAKDQKEMDEFAQALADYKKTLEARVSQLESLLTNSAQKRLLADFKTAWAKFDQIDEQVRTLSRENGNVKAFELASGKGRELADECQALMADIVKKNDEDMVADAEASDKNYASARLLMLIISFVGISTSLVLAFFIITGVIKAFQRIIDRLTNGSEQVASASGQVSGASQSLAEGSTEQAAGLEETSSSLEEMASMTKQNADNAQQANTLGAEARKAADTGTEAMQRMNTAINDIQKSSDETAKIIKVIDEIAFQTNLLALNAAVEAARAGEAGKGFAVVAEEVRNLAMRSAEAAKNTSAMIEESVKNSKNGVDIAGEVAKVLEEIVQSVGKTSDLVGEIAAASQEQSQGIDQVNTAMAQMDKVTQQNASNAEESASASEELSAQAESMNDVVAELVKLVGSSSSALGQRRSKSSNRQHASKNAGQGAPAKTHELLNKNPGLDKSDQTFHSIAGGRGKKQETGRTSNRNVQSAAPEKAIPLKGDDSSGTDDFKEFNG
jgi:methyl-accepting chemotaxis protein